MSIQAVIFIGKSCSGKTHLAQHLSNKRGFRRVITTTTRPPIEGEVNGVDYYFVTKSQFKEMINKNKFAEYVKRGEQYYGTTKEELTIPGKAVMVLDKEGAQKVRDILGDKCFVIYVNADNKTREQRALNRKKIDMDEWTERCMIDNREFLNYYSVANTVVDNSSDCLYELDELLNQFESQKA